MRVSVRLPCRWQAFEYMPRRRDLIDCFALPQVAVEVADLGRDVERELEKMTDKTMRHVLGLLNRRIDLLAATTQQTPDLPAEEVELSTDGIGLTTPEQLPGASWVGVYLIFDDGSDLLAAGRVRHSTPSQNGESGYRTGVGFADDEDYKALTRFVMRTGGT